MSKKDIYCKLVGVNSKRTGDEYTLRLTDFESFLNRRFNIPALDNFFDNKELDVYNVLSEYRLDLLERNISNTTVVCRITTVKNFFEYYDVNISKTKFKLKVRLPRQTPTDIEALTKEIIRKMLIACNNDMRLQTYLLLLASTGMRASEALSIRLRDVDFDNAKVHLRAQYTKTKRPRFTYLTKECLEHLKQWKEYRERTHRIVTRERKVKMVTRLFKPDELFFSTGRRDIVNDPRTIYHTLQAYFSAFCDRNGFATGYNMRRKYTFHSFRRFVKSTISDLGYQDYSEWFIGHAGSTYYRKTESEKLEIFRKVEPYITFLDYSKLEAQGADTQTQLEESRKEIEQLKKQMKSKESDFREEMQVFKKAVKDHIREMLSKGYSPANQSDD